MIVESREMFFFLALLLPSPIDIYSDSDDEKA